MRSIAPETFGWLPRPGSAVRTQVEIPEMPAYRQRGTASSPQTREDSGPTLGSLRQPLAAASIGEPPNASRLRGLNLARPEPSLGSASWRAEKQPEAGYSRSFLNFLRAIRVLLEMPKGRAMTYLIWS